MNAPSTQYREWLVSSASDVEQGAREAIKQRGGGAAHVRIGEALLDSSSVLADARNGRCTMALHLPLLVCMGIREDARPARGLAIATTMLETGIYAFDHFVDGELEPPLSDLGGAAVLLGAVGFFCIYPQFELLKLPITETLALRLQEMLAEGMAKMADGQLRDMDSQRSMDVTPESIEQAVLGKTGERRALYASMAAALAGAAPEQVARYADFGRSLGIARQLRSDLIDLFGDSPSRDLANGTVTLPLALYLARADTPDREAMNVLRLQARTEPGKQREVRRRLRESGTLREVIRRIETQCRNALDHLQLAAPVGAARDMLCQAVASISLVSR